MVKAPPESCTILTRTAKLPTLMIGYMYGTADLETLVFKCSMPECDGTTFKRWFELKRHYNGAHAEEGEVHWCGVVGCQRNEADGRPFPRKDKLKDHLRKVHGLNLV